MMECVGRCSLMVGRREATANHQRTTTNKRFHPSSIVRHQLFLHQPIALQVVAQKKVPLTKFFETPACIKINGSFVLFPYSQPDNFLLFCSCGFNTNLHQCGTYTLA